MDEDSGFDRMHRLAEEMRDSERRAENERDAVARRCFASLFGEQHEEVAKHMVFSGVRYTELEVAKYFHKLCDEQHPRFFEALRLLGQALDTALQCMDEEVGKSGYLVDHVRLCQELVAVTKARNCQ